MNQATWVVVVSTSFVLACGSKKEESGGDKPGAGAGTGTSAGTGTAAGTAAGTAPPPPPPAPVDAAPAASAAVASSDPCAGRWQGAYAPDQPFDIDPDSPEVDLIVWPKKGGYGVSAPEQDVWKLDQARRDGDTACRIVAAANLRSDEGLLDGTITLDVKDGVGTLSGTINDRKVTGTVTRTALGGPPVKLGKGESLDPPAGVEVGGALFDETAWHASPLAWDSASGPASVAIAWNEDKEYAKVLVATAAGTAELAKVDINLAHGATASLAIDGAVALVSITGSLGTEVPGFDETWRVTVDGGKPTATKAGE